MGDAAVYTLPVMRTTERMEVLRNFPSFKKPTPLDVQINAVLKKMQGLGVDHEEYPKMMNILDHLHEMKAKERPNRVSRDTIAIVVGNLLGILVIVVYEQKHVITSKGFNERIRPNIPK